MIPPLLLSLALAAATPQVNPVKPPLPRSAPPGGSPRSFRTGLYRNAFRDIGKSDAQIADRINAAWRQFFYGDAAEERVYFPVGVDEADCCTMIHRQVIPHRTALSSKLTAMPAVVE